jgi:hypothetical protein
MKEALNDSTWCLSLFFTQNGGNRLFVVRLILVLLLFSNMLMWSSNSAEAASGLRDLILLAGLR